MAMSFIPSRTLPCEHQFPLYLCSVALPLSFFVLTSTLSSLVKGRSQVGIQPAEFSGCNYGRCGFGCSPCGFGGSTLLSLSGKQVGTADKCPFTSGKVK